MIVDVHTHFFRPELDFGPRLRADLTRCGVNPAAWRTSFNLNEMPAP